MKKSMKIISILMVALMTISIITPVLATTIDGVTVDASDTSLATTGNLSGTLNKVLGALRYIGIIAAVAILMIIGIKYMMGSAEEKAEYKKTLIPYILGAVLLFAASFIVGIIADATKSVTNETALLINTFTYFG